MHKQEFSFEKDTSYQQLCSEFYDLLRPEASSNEVNFYSDFLKTIKGPILEAMCGSGRILIPLLEEGYQIDGVDNAVHMLSNCQKRCAAKQLNVQLFNQPLEELSLSKKYACIFIALGSFQHFADHRITAFQVLQRLHDHLLPEGSLLIDMIVPWGLIQADIQENLYSHEIRTVESQKTVTSYDGAKIISKTTAKVYPDEQLALSENYYEKVVNDKTTAREKESIAFRWYHRYEMELILEKAGFSVAHVWNESFEPHLQSTVYQAIKEKL
ncbi:MAG TPA: class I SAM-dependent methyltransferase [Parachlamydiaceae bacterium]|nr:class I SAM-dependent methyltransferase [Parachlamydiaceae bacterium]